MTLACVSERSLFAPDTIRAGATGSGTAALVGEWRTVLFVDIGVDVQTWTTTWRFQADGVCSMTRVVRSTLEDQTRTTVRPCRWTAANAAITAIYDDGTVSLLPFSFPRLDRNRLLLEGIEYARLGTG
jgi:hypothetical protein